MGQKVLLADDSITVQKIVKLSLHEEGIEVIAFGNGSQAIAEIENIRPDLIMADVFMPGNDGYEVCEFVKKHPQLGDTPVILLVHAFEPFDPDKARAVGADHQLTKPFQSIRTLTTSVKDLLAKVDEKVPAQHTSAFQDHGAHADSQNAPMVTFTPEPELEAAHAPVAAPVAPPLTAPAAAVPSLDASSFALPSMSPSLDMGEGNLAVADDSNLLPAVEMASVTNDEPPSLELDLSPAPAMAESVLEIPETPGPTENMSYELIVNQEDDSPVQLAPEPQPTLEMSVPETPEMPMVPMTSMMPEMPAMSAGFDLQSGVEQTATASGQDMASGTVPNTPGGRLEVNEELIEEIVNRVVQRLSAKAIQDVAWEVVPEMAEMMLKKQIYKQPQISH